MHEIILSPARLPPSSSLTRTLFLRPLRHGICVLAWVSVCNSWLPMPTTCSARPNDHGAQSWTIHLQCSTAWPSRNLCGRALSARLCTFATVPTIAPLALLTGGVPLTLLTSSAPDTSKFRVFECTVFTKVPDKSRRKLSEKPFRGVMVGYPPNAHGCRIFNPETRIITTSVHVVFLENTPGFNARLLVDSVIVDACDANDPPDTPLTSHPIDPTPPSSPSFDLPTTHVADRPSRLRSHPLRYGDLVAHMAQYPPILVTACCDHGQGRAT
jgi:hypothetical protein